MRIFILILFIASSPLAFGQQWVQFSQQDFYSNYMNPAYTGFNSTLNATLAHRSQYVGLSSKAIGSQYASFSSPVFTPKLGIGFRLINDFIGFQRYTNVELSAAYHILQKKHKLSMGLTLGMVQLGLDGSSLTAPDGSYLPGVVVHNDDFIPNVKSSGIAPAFSFGMLYSVKNFEFGIAAQHINSPAINISNSQGGTIIFLNRTINIHSSYVLKLKNINLKPSVFVKTDFVKVQAQAQVVMDWRKLLLGIGFRGYNGLNNDAIIAIFGFRIKKNVQVAYSYDYNVSFLNNSNFGSHEISVKFDLPIKFNPSVKNNVIFNPRFL